MVSFRHRGDFSKTTNFLEKARNINYRRILTGFAEQGVSALAAATPIDSGVTKSSWGYELRISDGFVRISWTNSHINEGVPIAIILQYGHATGTGGYVQGYDYINPALQPVFDMIAEEVWKEVIRL